MSSLTNPGHKVLSPFKLSHVVLHTANFAVMRDFYKIFLGGRATFENDQVSFQTYDEEDHRIGIISAPPGASHAKAGLAMAYLQRKNNGIEPVWCVNHGPTTSITYSDPDGNLLETQVENFDSVKESLAFLETDEFERNPIGVKFQPKDLVQRLLTGESHASIKKRPVNGKRAIPPL
ncbi:hypothetical protein M409DRAFT_70720 [Zasmidium cellare ATCC 36951]|uniref:VOC domain-containing protein n=1 Tax=Zasmidium cellare ATCC 36951 TaxID=1080233 RepID=A0A6A6C2C4_ZASCE|nr:uncharacterized protein M409DRAFT_70720 [Zasmidium cellare ATCC 36951]KAF2160002.1 hypothetical protein M409DRAFT_70720 [Zasmidium cellare ATCC 36951]